MCNERGRGAIGEHVVTDINILPIYVEVGEIDHVRCITNFPLILRATLA